MKKSYTATANTTHTFQFSEAEIDALDTSHISQGKFHVLDDNQGFVGEILSSDFYKKTYTIGINSNIYEIVISDELDILIKEMGLSLGNGQISKDIVAPMPGLVLTMHVQEGGAVKEGDPLLVLEAMKMENTLSAPRDGTVKSVSIQEGDTVSKNQLLIEME